MWNAERTGERRAANDLALQFPIPHFTFRIVGGANAGAPYRSDPHGTLLHLGREPAGGGGGVVRLSRLRPARRPIPREAAGARGPATLRGRPRGAVTLLSDREPRGAPGRRERDEYITRKVVDGMVARLREHDIPHSVRPFDGGHGLDEGVLRELVART